MRAVRIFSILFLLALLTAARFARAQAAPGPLTEQEYWSLVTVTRGKIRALDGKSAGEMRLTLDGLADTWSQVTEVQLEDGALVPVDTSYLVAAFKADPANLDSLPGLLQSLLDASVSFPRESFHASDLDPLRAILSRPEFQWRPNPIGELIQKLWDKFWDWVRSLLGDNEIVIPGKPLIFGAMIILLAILAYVFRDLFTDLVKESNVEASTEEDDRHLTSETAFRKAQNLSVQGDYRTAVRYLYLSSLLLMEERGILRYDRSRTNREYLRSVSTHPNLAKPLKSVVDVFDRVWYGYEPLDESTYKEYVDEVEELKEQKQ